MLKGQDIYDVDAYRKDGMANFKYPPLFASFTALFALVSEKTAAMIWFIFNFILIIIFMHYSGKLIFNGDLTRCQRNWIYFWALFLTSRFYLHNFDQGQVNFLMMTTILLGIYAAKKNREMLSGFLIGFSILIKYMSAIFIPYFIIKRKFRIVLFVLISLIVYSFLPALFWGWNKNLHMQSLYIPYVCKTSLDMYSLSDYPNQSLFGMILRFFSNYGEFNINIATLNDYKLGFISGSIFVLIFLFSLFPAKNNKQLNQEGNLNIVDISLLFVCTSIFNPNAWIHAFIYLTFGYLSIFYYLFKNKFKDKIVISLVVFSFILHSFSASFFTESWSGELSEAYSFVTMGAIVVLFSLFKIKFLPKTTL
jgi:hypothetical protein